MQRATQLILTLYGDYVRHRGGELGVNALTELMGSVGLSSQALRSALSRMARRGLLRARREGRRSYYSLSESGWALLTRGAEKIFRLSTPTPWNGQWAVVSYTIPETRRELRYRLRQELIELGYGYLGNACWVSPNNRNREVLLLASFLGLEGRVDLFYGTYEGSPSGRDLVRRCWDLDKTQDKYRRFLATYRSRLQAFKTALSSGPPWEPQACFVERFHLIHEYRRFHFFDPELPPELAPEDWLGPEAAALFQEYHGLLEARAFEFYDAATQKIGGVHVASGRNGKREVAAFENGRHASQSPRAASRVERVAILD